MTVHTLTQHFLRLLLRQREQQFRQVVSFRKAYLNFGLVSYWIWKDYSSLTNVLGDNYCDDVLNTAECQYDLGDCSSEPTGATAPTLIWTTGASPDVPDDCIIPDGVPAYWLGKLPDQERFFHSNKRFRRLLL